MNPNDNQILVIFGASGDLTYRKLIPSIYDLYCQAMLPDGFAVLGVSRTSYSDEEFRQRIEPGIREFANKKASVESKLDDFLSRIYYQPIDTKSKDDYGLLKDRLEKLDEKHQANQNYIFYLSTPPSLYTVIPDLLSAHELNRAPECGFRRLIVEKPFGYDLTTAQKLNRDLLTNFEEQQIYRIDHYLGKETVQNLLVTRFSNGIFEPLWNSKYIDHVQITSAENIGVGDRGGYYDGSGALRDMLQNHLLQIVGMVAMEPPSVVEATAIRNEVMKVFQSFRPIEENEVENYVIRGQYMESTVRGEHIKGYRQEKGVPKESRTPTYVAMKFYIDNWRWGGVPFYIRTGKRLPTRVTEVVIQFKQTPHRLFKNVTGMMGGNQLIIRIQPNEGVKLKFGMKVPGAGFEVDPVSMDFHYSELQNKYMPSAYERLLLDAMLGDATLYGRGDAVEAAWEFVNPILIAWENRDDIPVYGYPSGTWGPEPADSMIEGEHMTWRYPCKNLADDETYCQL